ncbi:5-formyltetrahydrofolate cyclo-ligase [Sulfurospirillum sp. T05]|uniref:5-formyltetrahydrofolate cyclo-ligase n=1 Tax=Sulfurospirillum tamanense TaxID=2813362 RepID=A0ABS2WUH9_9BACT|nr:5-formyltetrahydrofolate cyclo-ligase [Sulfurospirillum tamanensis]MBN2965321.1 5-formyltetrahydrofolate cyclo-ligase [Sulfurospirillum tamanensis]
MESKEEFRARCLQKLKHHALRNKLRQDHAVLTKLALLLKDVKGKTILCYLPLKHEVNITKLMRSLRPDNRLLVPFMEGVSFKVVKFRLPIKKKRFSVLEPQNSQMIFSKIDIAIVPVVGVDGALRRIGHGKGMYDRFFSSLKCHPIVIFVQGADCFTTQHVGDAHDVQADFYITPNHFIKRRGFNDFRVFNRRRCRAI